MSELAVKASGLGHRYAKQTALEGIDFSIEAGTRCALIGPDGAGKSSLLGLIAGVKILQQGELDVLGGSISARRHRTSLYPRIAYMPQGLGQNLYPELSIRENIQFFATLFGLSKTDFKQRLPQLLSATDLTRFAERPAGKLSGGMKQKLGLACALMARPKVLLLDEPGVGVDPVSRQDLWRMVQALTDEGMAVVWSTAYLDEAERCESVLLLNQGKLLFDGPPRPALPAPAEIGRASCRERV